MSLDQQNSQGVEAALLAIAQAVAGNYDKLKTYTNTGSGGGTCFYIDLGVIKLAMGTTGGFSTTSGNNYYASLPVGFFTSVIAGSLFNPTSSAILSQVGSLLDTTKIQQYVATNATSVSISFIVIGK